jgi:hypothetical protein
MNLSDEVSNFVIWSPLNNAIKSRPNVQHMSLLEYFISKPQYPPLSYQKAHVHPFMQKAVYRQESHRLKSYNIIQKFNPKSHLRLKATQLWNSEKN